MTASSSPSTPATQTYFDLHTTGFGYLNRIREVKPDRGDAFLGCDIAALNGPANKPEYRRFDVRVSGTDAQHLVRRCWQAVDAERKVLIGFRLGDLWTDVFTYKRGKHAGETGVSLKARLLFISWIKIDGELVYKAEPKNADGTEDNNVSKASPDPKPAEKNLDSAPRAEAPPSPAPAKRTGSPTATTKGDSETTPATAEPF
jgi:hypothetical protein